MYWKEKCFGLSAETMIDRAVELRCVGGMYGEPNKPTEFMCLILKMLQIQPDFDIVVELIRNEDYKYVRLLGERPAPSELVKGVLGAGHWLAVGDLLHRGTAASCGACLCRGGCHQQAWMCCRGVGEARCCKETALLGYQVVPGV